MSKNEKFISKITGKYTERGELMSKFEKYEALALVSKNALERIDDFEWFCATMCANIFAWGYAHGVSNTVIINAIYEAIHDAEAEKDTYEI